MGSSLANVSSLLASVLVLVAATADAAAFHGAAAANLNDARYLFGRDSCSDFIEGP